MRRYLETLGAKRTSKYPEGCGDVSCKASDPTMVITHAGWRVSKQMARPCTSMDHQPITACLRPGEMHGHSLNTCSWSAPPILEAVMLLACSR